MNVFNKFANYIYYNNKEDIFFTITAILVGASVIVGLAHIIAYLDGIEVLLSDMVFVSIPMAVGLLYFAVLAIDGLISFLSSFITSGDVQIENFIISKLFPDYDVIGDKCVYFVAFTLPLSVIPMIFMFLCLVPFGWILMIIIGAFIGLVYLARFAYNIRKKLTVHINDPDAHTRLKENKNVK